MKFRIEIDLDSSSMIDSHYQEIGLLLNEHIINIIEECKNKENNICFNDYYCNIKDVNGNSIGLWSIKNK